jgi:hypothetical protein
MGGPITEGTKTMFDYVGSFESAVAALKRERRYRIFADLERKVGEFPRATWNSLPESGTWLSGVPTTILAWGSIQR